MILQETVLIILHKNNIQYFESLGYFIPRYKDKYYRMSIKRGTQIKVKVSDLPKESHTKILCKCDNCGIKRFIEYRQYRKFCPSCIMKTDEVRNKCSESSWLKGKFGKNSPWWNSELTDEDRENRKYNHTSWARKVKQRDNYICKSCGYVGKRNDGIMTAHHLNNQSVFKEQKLNENNGITLCQNCHINFHKLYGKKSTKENWEEFIYFQFPLFFYLLVV